MATFGPVDYVLLFAMLAASTGIGVYHSCKSGRKKTTAEFLLGNRKMGAIPITFSLLATFVSGATLLGGPTEIYVFGSQQSYFVLGFFIMYPTVIYLFLPVYYNLGITSINEYLERRFNRIIRKATAAIFIAQTLLFMSIIVYGPAIALEQATGFDFWICVLFIVGICTFYTSIGGIRAVMWTDVLQIIFVLIALIVIIIVGCLYVGGFYNVIEKSYEGNRLQEPDFSFDLRVRHTFWTQTLGCLFATLPYYGINQAQVQRFLAAKSLKTARRAIWGNMIGWIIMTALITMEGFVLYAKYQDCDPKLNHEIKTHNQLLPHFITNTLGNLTGFSGMFVACLLSGSLSTLSTGLNALAAVTFEDFIKAIGICSKMSETKATFTVKAIAFTYGGLCLLCLGVVQHFSTISEAALSIMGIIGGPMLGVFVLGMFLPWSNSTGAGIGLICGLIESIWITVGAAFIDRPKPFLEMSIEGCPANLTSSSFITSNYTTTESLFNTTFLNTTFVNRTTPYPSVTSSHTYSTSSASPLYNYYSISYMWYSMLSCTIVVVVGLIISFLTGPQKMDQLDPKLLSPLTRTIIGKMSKNLRVYLKCDIVEEVEMEPMNNDHSKILITDISLPIKQST